MAQIFKTDMADFDAQFMLLCNPVEKMQADISAQVADIIFEIRQKGDEALKAFSKKFDKFTLCDDQFFFSANDIDREIAKISEADKKALDVAFARIKAYHIHQIPKDKEWKDEAGVRMGWRWNPIDSVGLYVPGGTASYPSSVLMNGVPAQIAGVREIVMITPLTFSNAVNPLVLYAARLVGVEKIYRFGGAHGVAALAYGTDKVRGVDKIVGPGNAYVAEAKRQVFGQVGIDMIAGPSEVVVIADDDNDPEWVAMDLLAQAEHDSVARAILITDCSELAYRVEKRVAHHLNHLARQEIAKKSWEHTSAIIIVKNLEEAARLANKIAPEHLQLCVEEPRALFDHITYAGAVFLGKWTAEAMGDYIIGANHVLPTARSARYSSGLSVLDFMTYSTVSELSPNAFYRLGAQAARLAHAEGLEAHAHSVELRLDMCNIGKNKNT